MNNPDFVLKRHEMFSMFYTIEQVNRAFIINDVVLCDNEDYSVGKRDFERHLCRILFVTIFCLFILSMSFWQKKGEETFFGGIQFEKLNHATVMAIMFLLSFMFYILIFYILFDL